MKIIKHISTKVDFWNLFIGIVIGAGVGMYLFSFLVPSGLQMVKVYGLEKYRKYHNGYLGMNHMMVANPYMMSVISSEKGFLKEMILHHEAAVAMAEQVLILNPSQKVKDLANEIISAQTEEIETMKNWLK